MGQYHLTINLDKKEFLYPYKLGDGLKLHEQCGWSPGGINDALHLLLACSSGRGGGDFQSDSPFVGSWAGDRIAVIGDYAESDDIPGFDAEQVYELCGGDNPEYKDITDDLIPVLEMEYECVYVGDGWRDRVQLSEIEGYSGLDGIGDRNIRFYIKDVYYNFPSSLVRTKLTEYSEKHGKYSKPVPITIFNLGLVEDTFN